MNTVSVHCKSFLFTVRLQVPCKTKLWAVLGPRQCRNWQRGFASFQIFPMAHGGSQTISFLEAKLKTLKRINFPCLMSQFLSCVGSRVAETLCTHSPLQLSSDLSSWKKGGVRTSSSKASYQPASPWPPKARLQKCFKSSWDPWDLQSPSHCLVTCFYLYQIIFFCSIHSSLNQRTYWIYCALVFGLFFLIQFIVSITPISEMKNIFKTISDDFLYKQYKLSWFGFCVCK